MNTTDAKSRRLIAAIVRTLLADGITSRTGFYEKYDRNISVLKLTGIKQIGLKRAEKLHELLKLSDEDWTAETGLPA